MAAVEIQGLNISTKDKIIYKDFNFTAEKNSVTGILAPSGYGKTTLLNWIAGLLDDKFEHTPYENFGKISYIFQEPRLIPNLTVLENVAMGLYKIYGKNQAKTKALIYLEKMEIAEKSKKYPYELSGGEQQRVSIARALAFPCEILLLDEPFQSLDKELKYKILSYIKEILLENPKTVIFVSHDEQELQFLCTKIVKF